MIFVELHMHLVDLVVKINNDIKDSLLFFGEGHVHLTSDHSLLWFLNTPSLGASVRSGI